MFSAICLQNFHNFIWLIYPPKVTAFPQPPSPHPWEGQFRHLIRNMDIRGPFSLLSISPFSNFNLYANIDIIYFTFLGLGFVILRWYSIELGQPLIVCDRFDSPAARFRVLFLVRILSPFICFVRLNLRLKIWFLFSSMRLLSFCLKKNWFDWIGVCWGFG